MNSSGRSGGFGDVERLFSAMTGNTNNTQNNNNTNGQANFKSSSNSSSSLDTNPRHSKHEDVNLEKSVSLSYVRRDEVVVKRDDDRYTSRRERRDSNDVFKRERSDLDYDDINRRERGRRSYDGSKRRSHDRGYDDKVRYKDYDREYDDRRERQDSGNKYRERSRSPEYKRREYSPRRESQSRDYTSGFGSFADRPKTPPLPPSLSPPINEPQRGFEDDRVQRDRRTVLVSQIAAKVQSFDLEKFFKDNNCKVGQVRLVMNKSHLRHKGVAYVEFIDESFVRSAIALTGSKLMGMPLVIQLTETEKNRLAQMQNSNSDLVKKTTKLPLADLGLTCIQIDFVHPSVEESTLRQLLRPFGHLENLKIVTDIEGKPRGTAFCKYKDPLDAKEAVNRLQDYLLVGQRLKLALVKDSIARFIDNVGVEEELNLTAQARTELMLKWARSKNILPGSTSLVIRNLPLEQEAGYSLEADLRIELERYGPVQELTVNRGEAIVKYGDMESAEKALNALNGRFFAYRQLQVIRNQ